MVLYFLRQLRMVKFEPEFLTNVTTKLNLIERHASQQDFRKVGSEATNLIYILVANLAGRGGNLAAGGRQRRFHRRRKNLQRDSVQIHVRLAGVIDQHRRHLPPGIPRL